MKKALYTLILRSRNRHLFALDIIIFSLTPVLSLLLRLESLQAVTDFAASLAVYIVITMSLKFGVFYFTDLYNRYWRYASVDEIVTLGYATVTGWLLCTLTFFTVLIPTGLVQAGFPRSIPFIDGILTMLLVGGIRFGLQLVYVLNERKPTPATSKNALIVGAGMAGSMFVRELRDNPRFGIKPVCYVDDNPAKRGAVIHGVKVQGSLRDIPHLISLHNISEVIIAMPEAPGAIIRSVVQACKKANVVSKTIPSVFEILSGSAVAQLREVNIEDLLRRGTIHIETRDVEKILTGASVLVTGAGGSIGSELCRQIVRFRPKELVLLGHGENSIFRIAGELRNRQGLVSESIHIHTVIADIRDKDRMNHVFRTYRPEIVFHAAAHKHVGLMQVNLCDAVTNNVEGTRTLVDLADKHDVKRLVMISSDKAVNPTSIMGVTKRVAELVVHDAAGRTGKNFVAVRFGNVLGSSGSVVPIFRQQIQEGGPVKITHPDVTRFFMTIPEAVQLVLQAGTMGRGGEIFVLDMGEPVRILDLARDLIRLSGLTEGVDIDIEFIGLQKGEKMHESLFYDTERPVRSRHEKLFVCRNGNSSIAGTMSPHDVMNKVDVVIQAAHAANSELINRTLVSIVAQYCDGDSLSVERDRHAVSPVLKTLNPKDVFDAPAQSVGSG